MVLFFKNLKKYLAEPVVWFVEAELNHFLILVKDFPIPRRLIRVSCWELNCFSMYGTSACFINWSMKARILSRSVESKHCPWIVLKSLSEYGGVCRLELEFENEPFEGKYPFMDEISDEEYPDVEGSPIWGITDIANNEECGGTEVEITEMGVMVEMEELDDWVAESLSV